MIVVIANCQASAWARTLALIFPGHDVHAFYGQDTRNPDKADAIRALVGEADTVFTLDWDDSHGDFAASRIDTITRRAIVIPWFGFSAFHPDLAYIQSASGATEQSPLGDYHSLVCAAAFSLGLDEARTLRLFNALVFRRLGYLGRFEQDCEDLVRRFAEHGYDIAASLADWTRRGAFMMSVNHPRAYVIADIVKLVCRTHGVGRVHDVDYSGYFPDDLAQSSIFPVYPEIARPLGIAGDYLFKAPSRPHSTALLDLPEFVAGSFAAYRQTDPQGWTDPQGHLPHAMTVLGAFG